MFASITFNANTRMVRIQRARRCCQRTGSLTRLFVCLVMCGWLGFVQPGVSSYSLIDPQLHAEIDAERYDQLPDGRTLPGHPYHPPHEHPSTGGLPTTHPAALDDASANSGAIFGEARRPSLQNSYVETAVIAHAVFLDPPEHPPRA